MYLMDGHLIKSTRKGAASNYLEKRLDGADNKLDLGPTYQQSRSLVTSHLYASLTARQDWTNPLTTSDRSCTRYCSQWGRNLLEPTYPDTKSVTMLSAQFLIYKQHPYPVHPAYSIPPFMRPSFRQRHFPTHLPAASTPPQLRGLRKTPAGSNIALSAVRRPPSFWCTPQS